MAGKWRRGVWRLTDIFPTRAAFLGHVSSIPSAAKIRSKIYREGWRKPRGVGDLAALLGYYFGIEEKVDLAIDYATLKSHSEYLTVSEVERDLQITADLDDRLTRVFSFMEPLILGLLEDKPRWFKSKMLAPYSNFIGEIRRSSSYGKNIPGGRARDGGRAGNNKRRIRGGKGMLIDDLHTELASLRTRLRNESSQYGQIAESILSLDATIAPITDMSGKQVRISASNLEEILQSPDRQLRKMAFEALTDSHAKYANGVATALIAKIRSDGDEARARGFKSTVQMALAENGLHRDFHDAAIRAGRKMLPDLHRLLALRAKAMGLKSIAPWDRLASDIPEGKKDGDEGQFRKRRFTWAEGCAIILRSLAPMGDDYVAVARKALLEEGWFDRTKHPSKGNVAYAYHVGGVHPFVQMTWDGTIWGIFTATHELGHAMHFHLASRRLPTRDVYMSDAVAEVSSCLHEILLLYGLFTEADIHPSEAIHHAVMTLEATFFRQLMWAEFEARLSGELMTTGGLYPEDVARQCRDTVRFWMGPAWRRTRHDEHLWIQIPHLFDGHMVYQYSTSFAAAALLAERLLFGSRKSGLVNEKNKVGGVGPFRFDRRTNRRTAEKARSEILDFFSAGGSIPAGKLLSRHGLGGIAAMRAVGRLAGLLLTALGKGKR